MPRVTRLPARAASSTKRRDVARPSRFKLLLRRQRHHLRWVIGALAGLATVATVVLLVRSSGAGTIEPLQERFGRTVGLRVQQITITGQQNTPMPLLQAALGVSAGDPILGFSVERARRQIEGLSWVAHVAVERRLPGTIYVSITERRPFAIWQNLGKFQLIDRDGQIVTDEDLANFSMLTLVVGAGAPSHAAALLDTLGGFPQIKPRVAAASWIGERRWNLRMRGGMTILLPEGHEAAALAKLDAMQTSHQLLDRPLLAIDLRQPERMVLRANPAAADGPAPAPAAAIPTPPLRAPLPAHRATRRVPVQTPAVDPAPIDAGRNAT